MLDKFLDNTNGRYTANVINGESEVQSNLKKLHQISQENTELGCLQILC